MKKYFKPKGAIFMTDSFFCFDSQELFVTVSYHGFMRILERFEIREDRVLAYADRAWRNGKTIDRYSGKAKRFLEEIQNRHDPAGVTLRIFSHKCFIFSKQGKLITAYGLDDFFAEVNRKANRPKLRRIGDIDMCDIAYFSDYTVLIHFKFGLKKKLSNRKDVSLCHSLIMRFLIRMLWENTSDVSSRFVI